MASLLGASGNSNGSGDGNGNGGSGGEYFFELSREGKYTFALLMIGMTFIYADSNLIAPNLTKMAREFHFTDLERDEKLGGEIAFAFFLLGVPACVLIGILADNFSRVRLFAFSIFLGQGPNLFISLVRSYEQLLFIRALTGIAVGGALPLVFSLAGDLFPVHRRSHASAIVGLFMAFGVGLGQGIAGYAGSKYGWRTPFIIVALPGVIVGVLFLASVKEPKRGVMDGNSYSSDDLNSASELSRVERAPSIWEQVKKGAKTSWVSLRSVLYVRTNGFALLQGIPGCVPWSVINAFMNDYLATNKGLGVPNATSIMLGFSAGGFLGMLFGGIVGQRAYNESIRLFCNLMALMVVLGGIPWLYLVETDNYSGSFINMALHICVAIIAGVLCTYAGVNVRAMVMHVNPPDQRGAAFSLFNLTDDIGRGFGPWVVAKMVGVLGRKRAFFLSFSAWGVCAYLLYLCGDTLSKDAEDVRSGAILANRESEHRSASSTTRDGENPASPAFARQIGEDEDETKRLLSAERDWEVEDTQPKRASSKNVSFESSKGD